MTAESPSQIALTTSDAAGDYRFISLGPDTYAVRVEKTGYDPTSQVGVVIFADQSIQANVTITPTLKTIAKVSATSSSGTQLRPGTTSDVYSVNATGIKTTVATSGAGSLNQVYGAIGSVPGVNIPTNQQGWNQGVYVRGGDYQQVAYEFDGLPLTRMSDLNPIATLSTLGTQEVQVYTGGTAASSNSSGLAGYINQVIKTGTSPGYATANLGIGAPAFYHAATVELSGATPDRLFSYYAGFSGANQDYRYGDQFNGVANPLYFFPIAIPTANSTFNILDGSCGDATLSTACPGPNYGAAFSQGASFAQATNFDRENVVNMHLGIRHRHDLQKDDLQFLFVTGGINTWFYSSQEEVGQGPITAAYGSYPMLYFDSTYYNGQVMQAPNPANLVPGPFPNTAPHAFAGPMPTNLRDGSFNGYSIEKLQYQKNFNDHSFLRLVGFGEYTDWFITGPNSADLTFGAELPGYEVNGHVFGGGLTYTNQLSPKHLVTAQAAYSQQVLQTYNATFTSTDPATTSLAPTGLGTVLTSYVGNDNNCYSYTTGQRWSCFDAGSQGGCLTPAPTACYGGPTDPGLNLTPGSAPSGSPAALAGAHWIVTENGQSAQPTDNVKPLFSSFALTDLWQPNDKITVNLGVRYDHFAYALNDLNAGFPARNFWFYQYNREFCGAPGQQTVWSWDAAMSSFGSCPAGFQPMANPDGSSNGNGLYNTGAELLVHNVFQPRISFTWTLNPNTVLRGSYGKYARAEASSYYQSNAFQQNLASVIAPFYPYGYHTPNHDLLPDTSNNYDLSLEQHLKGTNLSYKLTPFYRNTQNQVQFQSINPLGGTLQGLNVGTQTSKGIELAFQEGDFARSGLSFLLAYTYTNNAITFHPINGISVIDSLNNFIAQYNAYTTSSPCYTLATTSPSGTIVPGTPSACVAGTTVNPYFGKPQQALLDPNGSYAPYDVIPSPFNAANGFEVPNVASLVINYRHDKYTITPSLRWSSGSVYGSPLVWPGYLPDFCTQNPALTPTTPGVSCGAGGAIFLPDPYNGNQFDNLGTFKQPSQLALNLSASYDVSPRITLEFSIVNLYNKCYQRGYAWDNPQTCVYSTLPSNILAPAGNFLTTPPIQVKYPYGTFFNITEVGTSSVIQPANYYFNLVIKI